MKHNPEQRPEPTVRKKSRLSQILVFTLLLILGIIVSSEFNSIRKNNKALEEVKSNYDHFADMLQQEKLREANLEQRVEDLTAQLYASYDTFLEERGYDQLKDSWLQARTFAGLTDVNGTGIQITMNDAQNIDSGNSRTVIHDVDVQYIVDSLRALGAKAISINDERILGTSNLICNGPTILVNRKYLPVPYVIVAIGNTETLVNNLSGDSYLLSRKADGIRIAIKAMDSAIVPAYLDSQFIEHQVDLLEAAGS